MTNAEINEWATRFAADLCVGEERVPLDRVIAAHLPTILALRSSRLTWRAIASIVTRGGARRAGGGPISSDQFRADATRLIRQRTEVGSATPAVQLLTERLVKVRRGQASIKSKRTTRAPKPRSHVGDSEIAMTPKISASKPISGNDIVAAMARIQK